jgi:hypothetical protein
LDIVARGIVVIPLHNMMIVDGCAGDDAVDRAHDRDANDASEDRITVGTTRCVRGKGRQVADLSDRPSQKLSSTFAAAQRDRENIHGTRFVPEPRIHSTDANMGGTEGGSKK